jgi:hypothetical protein
MKKCPALSRLLFAAAPLLAALLLAALPSAAQDASGNPKRQDNRFLFIFDTSAAMRACSNASLQTVVALLVSDMQGEFRQGDTLGLWTFDDSLHTDFPMQVWSQEDKIAIVGDMAVYLRDLPYGKKAHLERVMPALRQVIRNSRRLTVVLVSDGKGLIQGTPFDREINNQQKKYARELRHARQPFVLVLAARDGAVYDYTINYPGPVAIPHTAYPETPAQTNAPVAAAPPPAPTNAPAPPQPTHSIIMIATNAAHPAAPPPVSVAAPPAPTPQPSPPVPSPVAAPVVAPVPATPLIAVAAPAPVSRPAPAAAPPAPEVAAPPPQPAPPVVARQNPEPAVAAPVRAPAAETTPGGPSPAPAPPAVRNAPVANVAPPGGPQWALYVAAFSLLTVAVVLVFLLARRSRRPPQPSIISQSINRPR